MSDPIRRLRPTRATLTGATVLLLVVLAAAPGNAQDEEAPPAPDRLQIGPWVGSGGAVGTFGGEFQGADLFWDGELNLDLQTEVSDGGSFRDGRWWISGAGEASAMGEVEGAELEIRTMPVYDGTGTVTGSGASMLLNGTLDITGSWAIAAAGEDFDPTVFEEKVTVDDLELRILAATCNEAYADWALAMESGFEQGAPVMALTLTGGLTLLRDVPDVRSQIADYVEAIEFGGAVADSDLPEDNVFVLAAMIREEYNSLVEKFPDWPVQEVFDIVGRAEELHNIFRNLTECDRGLYGEDNVRYFFNGLTFVIQNLLVQPIPDLPAKSWQSLVQIAYRVGSAGPGSPLPDLSDEVEANLIEMANDILAAHTDENGDIEVNDETTIVMSTLAAMNWDYEIDGVPYSGRGTYEATIGDAPEEP